MKKLIFIVLILASCHSYSQPTRFAKIIPVAAHPTDTFYAGDSIILDFTWQKPTVAPFIDTSHIDVVSLKNSIIMRIWEDKWQQLRTFPVVDRVGSDSIQRIRMKLPSNIDTGNAFLIVTFTNYPIYIKPKVATAIRTNISESKILYSKFYDIKGVEFTEEPYNTAYIKVDFYDNGSFNSKRQFRIYQ